MSLKYRCIKVVAWLNFGLAIAGLVKFVPIAYLMVLSRWEPIARSDYEWSLDLISDTYLIVMVWGCVLVSTNVASGHNMIFPWRSLTSEQ